MYRVMICFIMIGCLGGCAAGSQAGPRPRASVEIQTKDSAVVVSKLSELCDRNGYRIDTSTSNSVTCSHDGGLAAQILLGTRYGSGVRQRVQFNTFPTAPGLIKVVPELWMESQTAFGQIKRTDLQTNNQNGSTQNVLNIAKQEIEQAEQHN